MNIKPDFSNYTLFKQSIAEQGLDLHIELLISRVTQECDKHESHINNLVSASLSILGILIGAGITLMLSFTPITSSLTEKLDGDMLLDLLFLALLFCLAIFAIAIIIINIILIIRDSNRRYQKLCRIKHYLLKMEAEMIVG